MAPQAPIYDLPKEVVQDLSPSRYCQSDQLMNEAWGRSG